MQDALVLGNVDNGKLDGSAVHVVESAPPTATANSNSNRTTQSDLLGGGTTSRATIRRERSAANRETFMRSRVTRMEELLGNLNASITAMQNGTAPEHSTQYAESSTSAFPTSNPIMVTDLAGFVGQMADGIERLPPRLREVQTFLAEDSALPNR